MESYLESSSYFAGDRPTIADVSILSTFILFQNTFGDFGEIPNITAWFKRCESLPGFEENFASSIGTKERMAAKEMSPVSLN